MCHKVTEVTELLCSLSWTQGMGHQLRLLEEEREFVCIMAKVSLHTLPTISLWPFLH